MANLEEKLKQILNEEAKPKETHPVMSFQQYCPECGDRNPEYRKPNLFCTKCGVPVGHKDHVDKIRKCWNCGNDEVKVQE